MTVTLILCLFHLEHDQWKIEIMKKIKNLRYLKCESRYHMMNEYYIFSLRRCSGFWRNYLHILRRLQKQTWCRRGARCLWKSFLKKRFRKRRKNLQKLNEENALFLRSTFDNWNTFYDLYIYTFGVNLATVMF